MNQIVSISDLKQNTATWIDFVSSHQQPIIISKHATPSAVIVDHDYFVALEEAVMDLTDALEAEKAKHEPRVDFEAAMAKLGL